MITDWDLENLRRQAREKLAELETENARLARMDSLLASARKTAGHFNDLLAAADHRIAEVAPRVELDNGFSIGMPRWAHPDHPDECKRRQDERDDIVKRFKAALPVSVDTIAKSRRTVENVRNRIANELDEILEQLPRGERCQFGIPADEYVEHTARTAALRGEPAGAVS